MARQSKSMRRNHKTVDEGHEFRHTTLGATYEAHNRGTVHRPIWVINDDEGTDLSIGTKVYPELFQPVHVTTPKPKRPRPDLDMGDAWPL